MLPERVGRGEGGGCHPEGDSEWQLLQFGRTMQDGPLFCFFAQMGLENTPFALFLTFRHLEERSLVGGP